MSSVPHVQTRFLSVLGHASIKKRARGSLMYASRCRFVHRTINLYISRPYNAFWRRFGLLPDLCSSFSATTDAPPRFWGPAELGVPRGARDYVSLTLGVVPHNNKATSRSCHLFSKVWPPDLSAFRSIWGPYSVKRPRVPQIVLNIAYSYIVV